MGNSESSVPDAEDYRMHNVPIKLPMPDPKELNAQFERVLGSMDLSPDKIKVLVNYDNDKKWELICDQDKVLIKNPPQYYIDTLQSYLDPSLRSKRFRRRIANSTKTLRELEISLRTNHIGWVREFLNEENQGLDVLVEYLAFAQLANTYGGVIPTHNNLLSTSKSSNSTGDLSVGYGSLPSVDKRSSVASSLSRNRNNSLPNRRTLKNSQTIVDRDDVHVCISCLRTIMNYQHGFRLVTSHPQCVNEIALSLNNKSLRTKSLVLELLAAVCLVEGGHEIILRAFNNFKVACAEPRRFFRLMQYFKAETDNIDFLVSCTQFINIVVHSVEDMNFRVHLQYEFTMLGLDEYLETLRLTESDRLKVQIQAYIDNMFDVSALLEDSELKTTALERVESLEDQVLTLNEKIQEQEYENMTTIVELEKQLSAKSNEITEIKAAIQKGLLMNGRLQEKSLPPLSKLGPPSDDTPGLNVKVKDPLTDINKSSTPPAPTISFSSKSGGDLPPAPPAPPAPPPPPPPPPPGAPPPPEKPINPLHFMKGEKFQMNGMPSFPGSSNLPGGLRAKPRHQTKYRLPVLNWKALKPNQVAGTVFTELNDDNVLNELDMNAFEEIFKTRAQDSDADKLRMKKLTEAKQKRGMSLIDVNRARNLSITLRKIGLSTDEICRAVYSYDLQALPLEYVEMLPRFIPNEVELKAFKQYEKDGKPFETLASEDKFMWLFGRVERLQQRLNIMIFIGNFNDTIHSLTPQLAAVIAASMSIKSSQKLKKVLEIILALGNYMNSSKRGAVYGFKLQSLDSLLDTKSTDKKQSLLHYIVSVIQTYYQDIQDFYQELRYVDKASKVSLDTLLSDVAQIKKGMGLTQREHETHHHPVIKEFLEMAEPKVQKLYSDAATSQEAFKAVAEYFGETPKAMPPETFFPMVDRFLKSYAKAEQDILNWKNQEAKKALRQGQQKKQKSKKTNHTKSENQNNNAKIEEERVIQELRSKQHRRDRRAVQSKDGVIEDNINYIKSEPYRRADAMNRSFKRKQRGERERVRKQPVSTML
uniref:formin-like protein 2 isoform X1 n=1 Tax=Styela clava TaxID=7725 RepID=UPI001939C229|nr:formin-like protein 2 isoform X1 [Styela clava]